jgi:hypothetical protein
MRNLNSGGCEFSAAHSGRPETSHDWLEPGAIQGPGDGGHLALASSRIKFTGQQ